MVKASTTDVNIRYSPKFLAALQRACLSALVSTVRGITRGVRATTLILACASRMSTGCMSEPVRERERESVCVCVCVRACRLICLGNRSICGTYTMPCAADSSKLMGDAGSSVRRAMPDNATRSCDTADHASVHQT